jgi:hypothetical protein
MVWNTRMPTLGPEAAFIFRITHVDNVAWILRNGIHCRSSSILDPNFVSIGSVDLIQKRTTRTVPVPPGGPFNDYVPFYFTPWSIMLYNIKTGYNGVTKRNNRDVAIIVSSLHHLAASGHRFVFTDSHAYGVEANFFSGLHHLREIDWPLLRSRNFQNDPEDPGKKGRYQAEALVHRAVPVRALLGIACCDAGVQAQLVQSAQQAGVPTEIKVLPNWYF